MSDLVGNHKDRFSNDIAHMDNLATLFFTYHQTLSLSVPLFYSESSKSVPFLGAEDVVDEVMTLLARLENDRQETDAAHEREKERVMRLSNKINSLCQRRITELPTVVQKGMAVSKLFLSKISIVAIDETSRWYPIWGILPAYILEIEHMAHMVKCSFFWLYVTEIHSNLQRCRSACIFAQFNQSLCCSQLRLNRPTSLSRIPREWGKHF